MNPYLLSDISEIEMIPGYLARFVHTENLTLSFLTVEAGSALPEHQHPHEQVSMVMEGEFELTLAGKPIRLFPGQVLVIPSGTLHSGKAITNCKLLDVFNPVREDYRKLSDKAAGKN
ncbi:MAG: cupin domain-containing protein [Chitinophagia bacterium]|jgi:quercetin dioxygenase-like cupin family protein|nr:cupin domain-containing protein [Chitinophagia bacterium]